MKFKVSLREMASSEISSMIDPGRMARIKEFDPHPVFKAFVVGHEGEAKGVMVGVGNVVKKWYRDAVEKLHERISAGLQLFNGHQPGTNDQAGRIPIGEVVGKRAMRIGERLSSVVACYIYPSFRHLPLDVASIEAEVKMETEGRGGLYVADVDRVTGIALGNSAVSQPGFAGATLLGELQAFAASKRVEDDLMDLTLEDVKAFLRQAKVKPSDLFGLEELGSDPSVIGLSESRVKERVAGVWREKKEAEEKLEKLQKEQGEKEAALSKQIVDLKISQARSNLGSLFEKEREGRKLDDRQTKFVQNRLDRFKPSDPDKVAEEFKTYLDSEITEYGKIAKEVFGIEPKPAEGEGKDRGTGPAKEGGDSGASGDPNAKYVDPKQNPMINPMV